MHEGDRRRRCIGSHGMKLNNIRKILFITLSNIGDVILTLPVLSALKDNFPDAKIDVVIGPRPKEIFTKDPRVDRIFSYDKHTRLKEKIDFIRRLRGEGYDLAVDMRTSLFPVLIGAKNRSSLISIDKGVTKHKRSVHLNRLKPLGIEYKGHKNIYVDDRDREKIRKLLEENGLRKEDILIGVSPACRSRLKEWRTKGFIEVINSLLRQGRYKIVLIGDAKQAHVSREIKDTVRHEALIDMIGKTNLNELFALIDAMQLLLTCDSACMHIACDLGVKVVAIFGPTDPEEYGPTGRDDIVIRKTLECSPCNKAICSLKHECMEHLNAKEVIEAVEHLI